MNAILKDEPAELSETNTKITPALNKLVQRCLEKKPERRFQTASDLGFALEALTLPSSSGTHRTEAIAAVLPERPRTYLPWFVAAALLLTTLGFAWAYFTRRPVSEAPLLKLTLPPPEKSSFTHFALSPDGQWLAFCAATGSKTQLWLRSLASHEAKVFEGTESATYPFWSPDSRFIGFFAGSKLKKVEVSGGLPITLCDVVVGTGATWNREGVIVISALGTRGLSRVPATGGVPELFLRNANRQIDLHDPHFLPDGQHFLYLVMSNNEKESGGIHLGSLDGKVQQPLLPDKSNVAYVTATVPGGQGDGYLLFARDGALLAQPFEATARQLRGEPFVVAARVGFTLGATTSYRRRSFTVSDNGLLIYDPLVGRQRSLVRMVGRSGNQIHSLDHLENVNVVRLSPDDRRFVVSRNNAEMLNNDLWLADVTGNNATRFTFDPGNDQFAVWSPDGGRLVWASNRNGQAFDLYVKDTSQAGQETLLYQTDLYKFPTDWSRDGRHILFRQISPQTKYDVMALPLADPQKPFAVLNSPANESAATFSPDGQWIAYQSDESGRYEIYVQLFQGGGGKRHVSSAGGIGPHWRGDGTELYYYAPDGKLMATTVTKGASLAFGTPVPLFEFRPSGNVILPYYSVSRDGQRFLLSTILETVPNAPLAVVQNWMAETKR
jgi:Tol biopolymer transport system component